MISVQQATQFILQNTTNFGEEVVPLAHATGRILRENLFADRDFPPFDRVTMDGIAVSFDSFQQGQRIFLIENQQAAGAPQLTLSAAAACLEVMTGAVLPKNTDAVVRYEDLEIIDKQATILIEAVHRGQNIHRQGADRRQGEIIVQAGGKISPAEIGVAATVGKSSLKVARLPKVAILSTGDELVDVEATPLPHQIRKSNAHALAAAVANWGIEAEMLHLADDPVEIETVLQECLQRCDALILSGGVSEGKFDFVPMALEKLSVKKLFHKVSQRPGKPFWFGRQENGAVVFAFPGNPVSTFMCLHRYFQPWLRASLGLPPFEERCAALSEDFSFKPNLTYFLQVKISYGLDGMVWAKPVAGGGSGDLANLVEADAFLELPAERENFSRGEVFSMIFFR